MEPLPPPGSPPRRLQPLGAGPRSVADAEGNAAAAGRFWTDADQPQQPPQQRPAVSAEDDAAIQGMSIAQLRGFISAAGLAYADCIEKPELQERAREAAATGKAVASLFSPAPEPAPARPPPVPPAAAASARASYVPAAPAPAPAGRGGRSPNNSSARSLFGSDGLKVDGGEAPRASPDSARAPAPPFPGAATGRAGLDATRAAVRLHRGHVTAEFWREESSWRNATLLNLVVHIRAAIMLAAGLGSFALAIQTDDEAAALPRPGHCDTLRRWIIVGSACVAMAGTLAPLTWRKLRATKLERGVGTAKRLREKGFGSSRLSRSKENSARHRSCSEKLGGCVAFPVTVCFIGAQVVGFRSETEQCSVALQNSSTLFICCLYFLVCFQCFCIQSIQCSLWKELDLTMIDDDDADVEHQRMRMASGKTPMSPPRGGRGQGGGGADDDDGDYDDDEEGQQQQQQQQRRQRAPEP
jgi:hypothetical protein